MFPSWVYFVVMAEALDDLTTSWSVLDFTLTHNSWVLAVSGRQYFTVNESDSSQFSLLPGTGFCKAAEQSNFQHEAK